MKPSTTIFLTSSIDGVGGIAIAIQTIVPTINALKRLRYDAYLSFSDSADRRVHDSDTLVDYSYLIDNIAVRDCKASDASVILLAICNNKYITWELEWI